MITYRVSVRLAQDVNKRNAGICKGRSVIDGNKVFGLVSNSEGQKGEGWGALVGRSKTL